MTPAAENSPEWWDALERAQEALMPDLDVAQTFGERHPEAYGGVWFDGARLQVGLTSLLPWTKELRGLFTLTDQIDIVEVTHTAHALARIQAEISAFTGWTAGGFNTLSRTSRHITISLAANAEADALRLIEQYGDAVQVRLGGQAYPPDPEGVPTARTGPTPTADRPDLELTVVLESDAVPGGQNPRGIVVIRNVGTSTTSFMTARTLIASVLDDHGDIAGAFDGWLHDDAVTPRLEPGGEAEIQFVGGTASPRPDYVTPPGEYRLVVQVRLCDPEMPGQKQVLITEPVPIRILPPASR